MLEKDIVKKIKDYVKQQGGFVVKYHGCPHNEKNAPDLLISLYGIFIGCEIKKGKEKPTNGQINKLVEIQRSGGTAFWCASLEEFKEQLELCITFS